MTPIRLVLLLHQHQPQNKDEATGGYKCPWVRQHAHKASYGIAPIGPMVPGFKPRIHPVSLLDV